MRASDTLLALLVVFIWGVSLVAIKLGLQAMGAVLVILGLALTVFGPKLFRMLRTRIGIPL